MRPSIPTDISPVLLQYAFCTSNLYCCCMQLRYDELRHFPGLEGSKVTAALPDLSLPDALPPILPRGATEGVRHPLVLSPLQVRNHMCQMCEAGEMKFGEGVGSCSMVKRRSAALQPCVAGTVLRPRTSLRIAGTRFDWIEESSYGTWHCMIQLAMYSCWADGGAVGRFGGARG